MNEALGWGIISTAQEDAMMWLNTGVLESGVQLVLNSDTTMCPLCKFLNLFKPESPYLKNRGKDYTRA